MTYTWLGINVGQVLSASRPNNFSHWPSHLLPQPWLRHWPSLATSGALSGPSGVHPGSAGALLLCSSLGAMAADFSGRKGFVVAASASCIDIVDMLCWFSVDIHIESQLEQLEDRTCTGLGRALASPWQLHGGAPHSAAGLAHGLPVTWRAQGCTQNRLVSPIV